MMMKLDKLFVNVYLDDERTAPWDWVQTHTPHQTIILLDAGCVSHLSLDHDLGDDAGIGTGYDVLKWLEEKVFTDRYFTPPREIKVHSANVSARKKMEQAIVSIYRRSEENYEWVRDSDRE